jgi:Succinylglutamate desuccinylase / Aspartoacylase family
MRIDSISGGIEPARLGRVEGVPVHLLDAAAFDLWQHLSGPTLFEIAGRHGGPLFVSVLLHGNEDSGWRAVQAVLRRHHGALLPRPLLLFVGNVAAARAKVRTLPGQEDYNRTWPGTAEPETPLARLMREVVEIVRTKSPFASIDIHNNSGHNPHYACVNRLDEAHLHLARLFGRSVVYFERPLGVQSGALAPIGPAVTVECGRAGEPASVAHAAELIEAALALQHFPEHPVPEHDIDLMRTFAIIKVPADASFSYDGADADFRFRSDLDHLNFSELDPGVVFGHLGNVGKRLDVQPANDPAAADRYFDYAGGQITLVQRAIPAMLTVDPNSVRLDCLGYLMHRIDRKGRRIPE